jgi:hypothetical protein
MSHIEATGENGALVFGSRQFEGPVVMLNLMRFRDEADYSDFPEIAPETPVTGRQAYDIYMKHTTPFLMAAGGGLDLMAEGGHPLIGPTDERWDLVLLVRYPNIEAFLGMASNQEYLAGFGHRTAALEDSRLIPLVTG